MDGKDPSTRFNAPRLWQTMEGDFSVEVRVTADWTLGPALSTGQNAFAAGLVVWDSEKQYLRHERILFRHRRLGTVNTFVPPIYDRNNARLSPIEIVESDYFKGRSTWLRLERSGQTISTSISHDGQNWKSTGTVTTEFPHTVQIGVHAINASGREFAAEFEEFSMTPK